MPRVALPAAAACDTHALVHYAFGDRRLGNQAAALFDACEARQAIIYVPAIVIVEFEFVLARRMARASMRLREFFEDLFDNPAFQAFELDAEQVYLANEAKPNNDPFDSLICAAARRLEVPLITRDAAIVRWGRIETVW